MERNLFWVTQNYRKDIFKNFLLTKFGSELQTWLRF